MVLRLPGRASSPSGFGQTTVLRHKEVHHFFFVPFREQPIYSTRAHVFQIDPNTKKNWMPTSKHAVTVSYFYDSTRNVYRIISLDGSKVNYPLLCMCRSLLIVFWDRKISLVLVLLVYLTVFYNFDTPQDLHSSSNKTVIKKYESNIRISSLSFDSTMHWDTAHNVVHATAQIY